MRASNGLARCDRTLTLLLDTLWSPFSNVLLTEVHVHMSSGVPLHAGAA